jgi:hypothetical protein
MGAANVLPAAAARFKNWRRDVFVLLAMRFSSAVKK